MITASVWKGATIDSCKWYPKDLADMGVLSLDITCALIMTMITLPLDILILPIELIVLIKHIIDNSFFEEEVKWSK